MEAVDEQLIQRIDSYIQSIFAPSDEALKENVKHSEAAGLPSIGVSPNQGKLLYLLTKIARAKRVLEIGTLGGYSTTWLARALPSDGKLISLELDAKHTAVARENLGRAGLETIVEIRTGHAADFLRTMVENREGPFDLVFIDADKPGYVEYLNLVMQLSRPGTVITADNVVRHGRVLDEAQADRNARAMRDFNATIASHAHLESIVVPIFRDCIDGMSISIVK